MKSIKTLSFIFFLLCFSYSKAQLVPLSQGPGCLFNGKVYQVLIGNHTDGTLLFAGVDSPCIGTYSDPNSPYWNETGGNGSCTVWINCAGTQNSNYKKGKLGNVVGVPIDDYVLPLLIVISVFVFFHLRKQQLSY